MVRSLRWAVVSCVAVWTLGAGAQSGLAIAGSVYEDRLALAVRPHFLAASGVTVKLYRDDGDRAPSAGDAAVATTKTNGAGTYVFRVDRAGDYWVTVDSHSFATGAWPEETFGPPGSLCAHPERGTYATLYEGPCFGGRTVQGGDDATSLLTSEHIAFVSVRDSATAVDFAFSYDAVVNTGDAGQGTLRQFFVNANAVRGVSRMRFVPVERAPEQRQTVIGTPPQWWIITLRSPLPEVRDEDTIVDGTAYNFLSPATPYDTNAGRFGEPPTLVSGERQISRLRKPELEVVANGSAGIVCEAPCGIRGLALHGASSGIITRANARIEHVLVGAAPDGTPANDGGVTGVQVERGALSAHHLLVTSQTRSGIVVTKEAKLDADHLDVSHCGEPLSGAGIVLLSTGSSIRSSVITSNPGAGIVLGTPDGNMPATGNTIDGNTISGNQAGIVIAPGSQRNAILRNDIMWNRLGGITITPFENLTAPRENRISANRFDENGLRPIILDLNTANPNELSRGAETCNTTASAAANRGIPAPRVTNVRVLDDGGLRATIRGQACPGQIIELYQSFVTSAVRGKAAEMPDVRDARTERETLNSEGRTMTLPSIGEFNYLGTTNTAADGTFEASFPLPSVTPVPVDETNREETDIWATQVLSSLAPGDRAFSAIAIDAAGNTSEMGVRRRGE